MRILIKSEKGGNVITSCNSANLESLQKKHGDKLRVLEEPRLKIIIKRFFCSKCGRHRPIIHKWGHRLCIDCKAANIIKTIKYYIE